MLWSGSQNSRILGLCCFQICLALAVPLRKKLAPLDARIFHLPSVVINLMTPFSHLYSLELPAKTKRPY